MSRRQLGLIVTLLTVMILTAACGLLQEPAAPSGQLEAEPLQVATQAPALDSETAATEEPPSGELVIEPEAYPAGEEAIAEAPAAAEEAYPAGEQPAAPDAAAQEETEAYPAEESSGAAGGLIIYSIDPDASQVRFELDEELRGQPTTVVGTTNEIVGEIGVDLADLSTAQVGVITVNARGFATDNNFRNRAIQNEILDTGQFEFITFTPTAVSGMPASIAVGEPVQFTVEGELTVRDTTLPATFEVTATAVSSNQLTGTAGTTINRADYGLVIPQVPNVANVEEEVELFIDFVANAS